LAGVSNAKPQEAANLAREQRAWCVNGYGRGVNEPALSIRARSPDGPFISSLDDWERLASTAGKWADGFSAKELARLWLAGEGAAVVQAALRSVLTDLHLVEAIAEAQISFDSYEGGVRNHDVLAYGYTAVGDVVVGVEGKVNEPLDDRISAKYAAAERRRAEGKNSNLDLRVDGLLDAILGRRMDDDPMVGGLRYQLFSAIAGTVAAATDETTAAAIVVHLIETPHAEPKKFEHTREAFADFASAAGLDCSSPVAGPIRLKRPIGSAHVDLPIWLTVTQTPCLPAE
jgi:hypothetical protein